MGLFPFAFLRFFRFEQQKFSSRRVPLFRYLTEVAELGGEGRGGESQQRKRPLCFCSLFALAILNWTKQRCFAPSMTARFVAYSITFAYFDLPYFDL